MRPVLVSLLLVETLLGVDLNPPKNDVIVPNPTPQITKIIGKHTPKPSRRPPIKSRLQSGPDLDNWYWITSEDPGGPVFNYYYASDPISLSGDDAGLWIDLPFTYQYRGNTYNQVFVCTNGFVSFSTLSTQPTNIQIPNPSAPNDALYPFWDDLNIIGSAEIDTGTYGVSPNRVFVIRWNNVPHYNNVGDADFELVLYESGEKVLFQYNDVTFGSWVFDSGASATVGVENIDGTTGLQYSHDTTAIYEGLAILFYQMNITQDAGVLQILSPQQNSPVSTTLTPVALVKNFGTDTISFSVTFQIYRQETLDYQANSYVTDLLPGDSISLTFNSWSSSIYGQYKARVYTNLVDDQNADNDTLEEFFYIGNQGSEFLIVDLDPQKSDGPSVYKFLQKNAYAGYYYDGTQVFDSLSTFQTVWVFLGIYPDNYVLTPTQSFKLMDYMNNGGNLLVSGGDAFAYDPTADTLAIYFGIDPDLSSDGDSGRTVLTGLSNTLVPEITSEDTWSYTGASGWLDSLVIDQSPPFTALTEPILSVGPGYNVGVAFHGQYWNAIGLSVSPTNISDYSVPPTGISYVSPPSESLTVWLMRFLKSPHWNSHDLSAIEINNPWEYYLIPNTTISPSAKITNRGVYTESNFYVLFGAYGLGNGYMYRDSIVVPTIQPAETLDITFNPWTIPSYSLDLIIFFQTILPSDSFVSNDVVLGAGYRTYALPGDIIKYAVLDSITGYSGHLGVHFDGEYFYLSVFDQSGNKVVVLDTSFSIVQEFNQPTTGFGFRDLSGWKVNSSLYSDLYAGYGNNVYKIRLDSTGTLSLIDTTSTIYSLVRGVGYNPEKIRILVGPGTGPISEIKPDGTLLGYYTANMLYYGIAYLPTDPESPSLSFWLSTQQADSNGFANTLFKYSGTTELTTDTLMLYYPHTLSEAYAGGLSYFPEYNGKQILIEVVQGVPFDLLYVIYLDDTPQDCKCGDINSDWYTTIDDIDPFTSYLFEGAPGIPWSCMDFNGDDRPTAADIIKLFKYSYDQIPNLNCGTYPQHKSETLPIKINK